MLSDVYHVLKAANRRRLAKRRARRGDYTVEPDYKDRHVISLSGGLRVDVVAEYGDRSLVRTADVVFPACGDTPEISIVIAAYGKVEYTLRCLQAIARNPPSVSFEVLVLEDASGDSDAARCGEVRGLRYIENEVNLGYLRTCNKGVRVSRGRYVYLLNNDTQVMPGAIDVLYQHCVGNDRLLVGSRLIYPDGTLQDAGGVVWADGAAWIYGRSDHPGRHAYNYPREVDYCSGASLMLARILWDEVGGYDERYAPAYYEDTDLAFQVRGVGGKVMYLPTSVVIHDEGVSHGTSVDHGLKAYQKINAGKFAQKWSAEIARDAYPVCTHLLKAKDRARTRKTIMVIDHYVPEPDQDAGSRSMLSFIDVLLGLGYAVKFWPDNFRATPGYTEALMAKGVEVFANPEVYTFQGWIKKNHDCVDGYLLSRPTVARHYIDTIRKVSKAPIVFYGHDLHFARMNMQVEVTGDERMRADARDMAALESRIWHAVDVSFYPSQEEVDLIHKMAPQVDVRRANAYCLDVKPPKLVCEQLDRVLFVAGFRHPPNEDAAKWLVESVMPIVWAARPSVNLVLAGSSPTEQVLALASDKVAVTGSLSAEDLASQYDQACVAVVPLRFGAGVKLKVLEAMVERVPLVTTTVGIQGLPDVGFLPVSDEPEVFAQYVLSLLADPPRREALATAQAHFIESHYSASALTHTLKQVF
jgi:GT2 family glycosyltransferase/glycosyltransferase involved in cell wall biosynthesis